MKLTFWKRDTAVSDSRFDARSQEGRSPSRRRIRVLMVDDEVSFTRMTKRNLEASGGFEVVTESRARSALAAARGFRPDIILLDVMMPDGDGGQVASEFAQDDELRRVPILFLTAAIKTSEVGRHGAGCVGGRVYVAKPVDLGNLVHLLEEHARVAR
jgi:DNA-binding response OmpR family regulator